jgi:hypothetical protein
MGAEYDCEAQSYFMNCKIILETSKLVCETLESFHDFIGLHGCSQASSWCSPYITLPSRCSVLMRKPPFPPARPVIKSKLHLSKGQGANAFWSIRVGPVKLCDQVGGINITFAQP